MEQSLILQIDYFKKHFSTGRLEIILYSDNNYIIICRKSINGWFCFNSKGKLIDRIPTGSIKSFIIKYLSISDSFLVSPYSKHLNNKLESIGCKHKSLF